MATLAHTRMAGEIFGNYEVVATLGKGGMGSVFLAEHQRISRSAAIKVLSPELTTNPDALKRFFTEARATSLIRHPGIVEVFDCDVDPRGRAFIVMEYLEGETLASCLHRVGALPWRIACAVGERIARAVGAAHERGIVHRDLKPDNVFLRGDDTAAASPGGEVKILDFGIAKLLSQDTTAESITRTGMVLGTPLYISPEQCSSSTEIDHRTDVYSLGCMLFEMICGHPPFEREGVRALMVAHMFESTPLASTRAPEIPAWLDGLIARMMAKQPDGRPATMTDVAEGLSQARSGTDHLSLPVERAPARTWILPANLRAARRANHLRRRGGMALAGAVGGLGAVAALAVLALSRPSTHEAAAADTSQSAGSGAGGPASTTTAAAAPAPPPPDHEMPAHDRASPQQSLASTLDPRSSVGVDPLSVLAPRSRPDASSAGLAATPPPRPPSRRRAGPPPNPRPRAESARMTAPIETDGIVDL